MIKRLALGLGLTALLAVSKADPWVRVPNTTLDLPQTPGNFGYTLVDPLGVTFNRPTSLAFPPGNTNAILVAEQDGRLVAVTNRSAPSRTVLLDLTESTALGPNEGLLAVEPHPDFGSNGRVFLFRTARIPGDATAQKYVQISEVRLAPDTLLPAGIPEIVMIRQPYFSLDHLGGDLKFGANGYLHASIGDGFDPISNSQRIDGGLFSAVLRIDVDHRPESLAPNPHPSVLGNYWIPPGNPYVGATQFLGGPVDPSQVRTEFYSVGLREPFRLTYDPETRALWVGDVGKDTFESVFVTLPGANHGWPAKEGPGDGILPGAVPPDFFVNPVYGYVPPIFSYIHTIGPCVIGGVIYRGTRLPELWGAYLLADHGYGWVGAIRVNNQGVGAIAGLSLYQPAITDFASDPINGDAWLSELERSRLLRLEHSAVFSGDPIPPTLAETGAFADLPTLTPEAGVVPYEVNHPFWSDDARKRRWFSIPNVEGKLGFKASGGWDLPTGTVWIKHFDLEITNGVPESSRRMETRFLVKQADGIYGVTYRWNSATNATLVSESGQDEDVERWIDGSRVTQRWHYPSRSECLSCHNRRAGFALGFDTAQLNRDIDWNGVRTNQIGAWIASGYVTNGPIAFQPLLQYAALDDTSASLEWRARSYLSANCSFCHQPGGAGLGTFDARFAIPTENAGLLGGVLLNLLGDSSNRVIAPGDPTHSVLLRRLSTRGTSQMPPLASNLADPRGAALLQSWILSTADRPVETPIRFAGSLETDSARLHLTQPANRALQLERCPDLARDGWSPVYVPGTERTFPATDRTVDLQVPASMLPAFFRVRTVAP
ncbi:MAG: PQQ-dependent sugar dehydrogenase [Verrucomicrobiales bacterium]|nr:PQQ-dependent sugar dehydrogenase [Verrucomicrobiales bacterium]